MMKNLIINILLFVCLSPIYGRTLKIVKLNTETIKIGVNNRVCGVGSTFEETEEIKWSVPKQDMWAKVVSGSSRELMHFTREAFASKKAKTPAEYFQKINHPSVRGDEMTFYEGKNKSLFSEKRIALAIGISNYLNLSSLNNPANDVTDVSEKLQSIGFDVHCWYDVNYNDFDTALKKFRAAASDYEVALLYYSGHGIQYEDANYLVPVDARLSIPEDLFKCYMLEDIYSKLKGTKCKTKLIFLDACRNIAPWKKTEELYREEDTDGITVVFSTGPNKFAYDGNDRNSPFAEAFLQNIDKPSPNALSTINTISLSLGPICERMGLKRQEAHILGSSSIDFTFVEKSSQTSGEIVVNDINQLIELAKANDARAYVPVAKYYLKNAAGITSYEQVHIYAVKAIQAGVDVREAKDLINKLELLGFYEVSNYKKPSF